jgi:hypothetical protein
MNHLVRLRVARLGLILSGLGLLSGGLLMCYCPGWFACAALISILPIKLGADFTKKLGILLCAGCLLMSVTALQKKQALAARAKIIRERSDTQNR